MKAKKVFTRILIVILSLAVAVGVFYLAFPKQAEDVTNWVTGLFQEEEPAPEEPPIVDEQPSTDEPSDVTPPAEQPGDSTPEDPSEPTESEPEEPVEPEPQTVSVDVYLCDTKTGTIEMDPSLLEDDYALGQFWQENYHETFMEQTDGMYSFSSIENVSTEDANAVKVIYYRHELDYTGVEATTSGTVSTIGFSDCKIMEASFGGSIYLSVTNEPDTYLPGEEISNFNKLYSYNVTSDIDDSFTGTVSVNLTTSNNSVTGDMEINVTVTYTGQVQACDIYFNNFLLYYNGIIEI